MSVKLAKTRGVVGLVGQGVDDLALQSISTLPATSQFIKALSPFHITLLTKDELRSLSPSQLSLLPLNSDINLASFYPVGVGSTPNLQTFWLAIVWAKGQRLRRSLGLSPKHFHITLSAQDTHENTTATPADKGINSLLPHQNLYPHLHSPDYLNHLTFTLHAFGQNDHPSFVEFITVEPNSHRGFLRLADASMKRSYWKVAMLGFACAWQRGGDVDGVRQYCEKKMLICSRETEWGPIFADTELHQIEETGEEVQRLLEVSWSAELEAALIEISDGAVPTLCMESREQLFVVGKKANSKKYKMPRFFRWLVPFTVALMSTPRSEEDIQALASLGVRHILTLTEEEPLRTDWFVHNPTIRNTFLPVPNFHPPSLEQMDFILRLVQDQRNLPILIHCGGGKGRAGTVAACYLAAYGFGPPPLHTLTQPTMSSSEAISSLRAMRPGSLETQQQEDFVGKWCSTIWKRQSVFPDDLAEEPPSTSIITEGDGGILVPDEAGADFFILVGLPGAGKSWFSESLRTRDSHGWIIVSQDESGSRSSCETQVGHKPHATKASGGRTPRYILDRCNTTSADRAQFLALANVWATKPVCVWFDYSRELCTSRAQNRAGHPTLPPGGRVRRAVEQMAGAFETPSLGEGFKAVVKITSFEASKELVMKLSRPVGLFKFPRTGHLVDLGSVTRDDLMFMPPKLEAGDKAEGQVIITEKVDGANMGFSLSSDRSTILVQNRSHYVNTNSQEQFKKLGLWMDRHREELLSILDRNNEHFPERYILFGEWLYATHSIPYTRLPDRFMAFDLYDRGAESFADRRMLEQLLAPTTIQLVPIMKQILGQKIPEDGELKAMVQEPSKFYEGRVEGIYVKIERRGRVVSRGKVVRGDFIAGNEHWGKGPLQVNGLAVDADFKAMKV